MATITLNNFDYPSYATVEDADRYFNAKFGSTWASIEKTDKEKLLITATREIEKLEFQGFKLDDEQPLQFPRVICCSQIEVDNENLIACCVEIANAFYNVGELACSMVTPNAENIKSMGIGDTSITFKDGASIEADVFSATASPIAKKYLGKWLRGNIRIIL